MRNIAPTPGNREHVVALLVGVGLSAVESQRVDVAAALKLIAERAWDEAYQEGLEIGSAAGWRKGGVRVGAAR